MQEPLDLAIDSAGIARLTLNRTKRANSLDAELTDKLLEALEYLGTLPNLRLVALLANGRSFCAGIDIAWMKESGGASYDDNYRDAIKLAYVLRALRNLPVPTVAAVAGPAIGFGVGLVAACDVAIAADTAKFRFSEVRLGILPAVISPYLIDAIGTRACRRYFLSAEDIEASEALRLGLVHVLAPLEEFGALVAHIVTQLLAGKPLAQRGVKSLLDAQRRPALDNDLIASTARQLAELRQGQEAQDALAEFIGG
jgi:methylglutaconyl-CoA hydratase